MSVRPFIRPSVTFRSLNATVKTIRTDKVYLSKLLTSTTQDDDDYTKMRTSVYMRIHRVS